MNWEQLLSLKRFGDTQQRLRSSQDETRLGFDVDFDRIIFSSAFRSLQDKTQVIPLSETDFVHTRLTHSLEVSVVGRTLGRRVGKILLERYPNLKKRGIPFVLEPFSRFKILSYCFFSGVTKGWIPYIMCY